MKKSFLLFLIFNEMLLYAQTPVDTVKIIFESDVLLAQVSATPQLVLLSSNGDTLKGRHVYWSSQNSAIATVSSNGFVTAIAEGQTNITATVEGKTGQATVTVESRSIYEDDNPGAFYDSNDPRQPIWDPILQGRIPNPADIRQQIVIDESFQVPAGQEVKWENLIVWIRPTQRKNINIYGKLNIRNSLVLWDQTEYSETRFDVQKGGVLRIVNSYANQRNVFWINWDFEDGSTIYFDHYQGDPWTAMHGSVNYTSINGSTTTMTLFQDVKNASITISDSHNAWLEIFPPSGTYQLSFPATRFWTDWQFPSLWPTTTFKITNSYLRGRDLALSNGVHVTIKDTPSGFSLGWTMYKLDQGFVDCELTNLGDPNNDSGVLYANKTWSLPAVNSSLTLINSRLLRSWPNAYGNVRLKVFSSNLVDPGFTGPATFEVYNSSIDRLTAWVGGSNEGAKIYAENCSIRSNIEVNGSGSIIYGYNLIQRDTTMFNVYEENGGKYIQLKNALKAYNISLTSGNSQSAYAGDTIRLPLTVVVSDSVGFSHGGTTVNFEITSFPSGAIGQKLLLQSVTTDSAGMASTFLTLGSVKGIYKVSATAPGLIGSPVTFMETAIENPTDISAELNIIPDNYILKDAYPNPFNPTTKIRFGLPENALTKLIIYDLLGRDVITLVNSELSAGYHEYEFNGGNLASGIYFYRISTPKFTSVKKLLLMK